jgi:hypothetical protein
MWDTYNKYASIIKDIINKYESENDAESNFIKLKIMLAKT